MKTICLALLIGLLATTSRAATTINAANHFSYGANFGWTEWRGDVASGAVIGEFVCSGFIYSANAGWINLGGGVPANGIRYQNNSAVDFGVNHDGSGNLHGLAYGANIGWLNFTNRDGTGASYAGPKVDLLTGRLSGFVWSANCGWISLSNGFAFVQTDAILRGVDSDGDGIADAFERFWTGNLTTMNATSDQDHDGSSDLAEYLADTNPLDPSDNLRIVDYKYLSPPLGIMETNFVAWRTRPSRYYHLEHRLNLDTGTPWVDVGVAYAPGFATTTSAFVNLAPVNGQRYWRVGAFQPLTP
jgi:hypothetical protein